MEIEKENKKKMSKTLEQYEELERMEIRELAKQGEKAREQRRINMFEMVEEDKKQKKLEMEERYGLGEEKIKLAFEIKTCIEYLMENDDHRRLIEGFVLNMSQELFLDFQYLNHYDSFFRYYPTFRQFDEFVFYAGSDDRDMPFVSISSIMDHEVRNGHYSSFGKLFTILKSKVKFNSDLHYFISIWGALKKIAIRHFSEQFADEYRDCHYLFKDGFENVLITSYINPEVDTNALMMLSYYLLHSDTTGDKSFFKYHEEIIEKVETEKKERNLANFEELLLTRNDKLSKVCKIEDVDMMDGYQFEEFVYVLFSKMGYVTQITKASGDQGVDVIAEKGTMKIAIQAKCYSGNVPNSSVQQIVAGARHYNCNKKIVITNSRFTQSAIELADSNNVVLWDRDLLKEKLLEAQLSVQ